MRLSFAHFAIALGWMPGATVLAAVPGFSDQTDTVGVAAIHDPVYSESFLAGGAVGDFDRDGWQDVFVPMGGGAADKLYINQRDGTFVDRATEWGIALQHRSTAAAVGDFDRDGWLDLYVTSLGPVGAGAVGHHRLYRNTRAGSFVDVAPVAGVSRSSATVPDGWGAAWGDYDLDGDLDLAVAGWTSNDGNRLFRNDGDGTFTDVTAEAGLGALTGVFGFAPRFADMDGDRYPELIWIGDFGTSRYYVNDGDGTFTNFTGPSQTANDGTEMGMTVADFDEDGDFDFYVTTISTNNLYINGGGNVYANRASQAGVVNTGWGWATVAIDFDHDTRIDIVATTQSNRQYAFINTTEPGGDLRFSEVAIDLGIDTPISGRGLSNFDYDNDGDQDLVFFPHRDPVQVFRNDLTGDDTHWLRVQLDRGCSSTVAPDGIGSVVQLELGGRTLLGRVDGGSNYLSQSELSAHFGLGAATVVDAVEVQWTDGTVTRLEGVEADRTLTLSAADLCGYCAANPNSTGEAAHLTAEGTPVIAEDDLTLVATGLPPGARAVIVASRDARTVEPSGQVAGYLCVGRDATPAHTGALIADAQGEIRWPLDLEQLVQRFGVAPGQQWSFQLWYRDSDPQPVTNSSDGLTVVFR